EGILLDEDKVLKIKDYSISTNLQQLRGFLGLASYYHRFIKNFSKLAWPLHDLLKKDRVYKWNKGQQESFKTLKQKLITVSVLNYPNFSRPFHLHTNTSGTGL
ncbi:16231_t:CDS:1, partial [Dentiscutata erythropus]